MRLVAALCWFNEPERFLDRCVRSLAGVVDVLFTLDGRWQHFPDERDLSPTSQQAAIELAAMDVGLRLVSHGGGQPFVWDSQVAKRSHMMVEASKLGDWILVIDSDCYLDPDRCDRAALDSILEATDRDVALIDCRPAERGDARSYPEGLRFLYRSAAGVTLGHAHNHYVTSDGRALHGDHAYVRVEPAEERSKDHLLMLHERNARGAERQRASREYHRLRARLGVERWPKGVRASLQESA